MDMKAFADFSDIEAYFDNGTSQVEDVMAETGKESVEQAAIRGNYKDQSGTLRKSNKSCVQHDKLILYNDATAPNGFQYAAKVESQGYDVLGSAALWAERTLNEKFNT